MGLFEILNGILNLGLPETLPQLRTAARVFTALGVACLTLCAVTPWPLARVAAVITGAGAITCWANAVRANIGLAVLAEERRKVEDERRAIARMAAIIAGDPEPPSLGRKHAA